MKQSTNLILLRFDVGLVPTEIIESPETNKSKNIFSTHFFIDSLNGVVDLLKKLPLIMKVF